MGTGFYYTDIQQAIEEEQSRGPGGLDVRFKLTAPVEDGSLRAIADHLSANGVDVISVTQSREDSNWIVSVKYRKPAESESISVLPVAIIPLVAFGFILVLAGVGIFNMETIANNIGKILLITFGGLTVFALAMRKPIESIGTAYAGRR